MLARTKCFNIIRTIYFIHTKYVSRPITEFKRLNHTYDSSKQSKKIQKRIYDNLADVDKETVQKNIEFELMIFAMEIGKFVWQFKDPSCEKENLKYWNFGPNAARIQTNNCLL